MNAASVTDASSVAQEESDFKTGFSYFYEAFECNNQFGEEGDDGNQNAVLCLKYMLLCKIMLKQKDEVNNIINGKYAVKYQGVNMEAMGAIATASNERSLQVIRALITVVCTTAQRSQYFTETARN